MRKALLWLLSVCLLLGTLGVFALAADNNYEKSYSAPYGTPTIDGAADFIWDIAPWESIDNNAAEGKMSGRFKVLHDATWIYFLFELNDPAVSAAKDEAIWFQFHSHTCADPDTCKNYKSDIMGVKGTAWDRIAKDFASTANFRVSSEVVGTTTRYLLEWAYAPAEGIPANGTTPYGLDFLIDDYEADDTWIDNQQTWNAYNTANVQIPGNFGDLYFMTAEETDKAYGPFFYRDVADTDEAYDAIVYTSERGIFVPASSANPLFYPDRKLSRAEFVTILGRLAGADVSGYTSTAFTDVNFARDRWFAKYAEWARVNGIVIGNQFMANKEISVSEAVVMLQRFATTVEDKYVATVVPLTTYTDASSVPTWAEAAMRWVAKNGIYPFSGSTLSPSKSVTRAMAAMLVMNYDLLSTNGNVDGKPGVTVVEPPSDIDWEKEAVINALEFGFVNDGVTPNDAIMAYYIEHYSDTVPLEFPAGKYVFRYQIDFPKRVFLELSPRAELILVSDTVQEFFITLQKDVLDYGGWDDYAQQSYIHGGKINANYCAKVGLGLHGGLHTDFSNFKLENVLEKGIQTEIGKGVYNGCYRFTNIYLYNDKAIAGTIAYYDNSADNIYTDCHALNFQTGIYTGGGKFTRVSCWFNFYGKELIKDSIYAHIVGGNQAVFTNPMVDTYRTGFKLEPNESGSYPSVSISDMVWITNNLFYTCGQYADNPNDNLQRDYPMIIFDVASDKSRVLVNGMYIPWREWGFRFSNIPLPNSSFIHVRYEAGWDPWNDMANFRDDTTRLKEGKDLYDWSDMP